MKKIISLIIITIIIATNTVYADSTLFSYSNPNEICNAVNSKKMKVGIENRISNITINVTDNTITGCSNTPYFNANLKTKTANDSYNPWTWHGRKSNNTQYYVENELQDREQYQYFAIANEFKANNSSGTLARTKTLQASDRIMFTIDFDTPISLTSLNDARIILDYGYYKTTDIDIGITNSLFFYVTDTSNKVTSYQLSDYHQIEQIKEIDGSTDSYIEKYRIVSSNLLSKISNTNKIKQIRIVPYAKYNIQSGMFRLYNISIKGYSDAYSNDFELRKIGGITENAMRASIVNTMYQEATYKWNVKPNQNLNFFSSQGQNKVNYYYNEGPFYGLPYVNNKSSTIQSFTNRTDKLENVNQYNKIPGTGDIYLYEGNHAGVGEPTWTKNNNTLQGVDCSASTYYALNTNIQSSILMDASRAYLLSPEVKLLGDLTFDFAAFEKTLRESNNDLVKDEAQGNRFDPNSQLTYDVYKKYAIKYIKQKNSAQTFYEGYARLKPGDFITTFGHTRMVTGYSIVKCNNSSSYTQNYASNYCSSRGEIDPNNSYVITTEIVSSLNNNTDTLAINKLGPEKYYNLLKTTTFANNGFTDLTAINQISGKKSNFIVNHKYKFSDLYYSGNNSSLKVYLPYRYKAISNIVNNGHKIEKPSITKIGLSNALMVKTNKYLQGQIVSNYLIEEIRYEINGQTISHYPFQTHFYSLYKDAPTAVKNAITTAAADPTHMRIKITALSGTKVSSIIDLSQNVSQNAPSLKVMPTQLGYLDINKSITPTLLANNISENLVLEINTEEHPEELTGSYNPITAPTELVDEDAEDYVPTPTDSTDGEYIKDLTDVDDGGDPVSYPDEDLNIVMLADDYVEDVQPTQIASEQPPKNPGTGAFVSILTIVFLITIGAIVYKYKDKFARFTKV